MDTEELIHMLFSQRRYDTINTIIKSKDVSRQKESILDLYVSIVSPYRDKLPHYLEFHSKVTARKMLCLSASL